MKQIMLVGGPASGRIMDAPLRDWYLVPVMPPMDYRPDSERDVRESIVVYERRTLPLLAEQTGPGYLVTVWAVRGMTPDEIVDEVQRILMTQWIKETGRKVQR